MSIEEELKTLARDIEFMNQKHVKLQDIFDTIKTSDSFTHTEKEQITQKFNTFEEEREHKLEVFRQKFDFYENKLKPIMHKITERKEITEKYSNDQDVKEFIDIMDPENEALNTNLEKYRDTIKC